MLKDYALLVALTILLIGVPFGVLEFFFGG